MILVPIKRLPVALVAWGLLVTIGNLLLSGFQIDNLYLSFIANLYVLEFIAGCFIGLAYKTGRLKAGAVPLVAALIWFSTSAVLLQINEIPDGFRGWSRVAFYSVPSVLFVYGLLALEVTGVWTKIPSWLVSAGNASYSLYLTHILFIHVAYRVAFKSIFASNGFIFLPFCVIASFVVGAVFYRLVEIPTTGLARDLLSRILAQKSRQPRVVSP